MGPAAGRIPGGSIADLVDGYTGRALALARRITADDRLAEDVVQESFLAYWRNPSAFDGARSSFASWFLALVHHKAVDAVRRESAHRRRSDALAARDGQELVPDAAELAGDPVGNARLRTALAALPAQQREALVLAYWCGFTQREIAACTGAPLGTVKTRMLTGMRRLKDELDAGVPATTLHPTA